MSIFIFAFEILVLEKYLSSILNIIKSTDIVSAKM